MSSSEPRSTAIPKYFTKKAVKVGPTGGIVTIVTGGVFCLFGVVLMIQPGSEHLITLWFCSLSLGVLFLLLGIVMLISNKSRYARDMARTEPKPSDAQMDAWLKADQARIISISKSKLGLPNESILNADDPLIVIGPATEAIIKAGDDGVFRFSRYEIVIIYLTDYNLGSYTCELDFFTGTVTREETQEYSYTDVIAVSTMVINTPFTVETLDGYKYPIASLQVFSLSVANGDSIRVVVAFPQLPGLLKTGRLAPTGAEKAIGTLRTMLRDKKGGGRHL